MLTGTESQLHLVIQLLVPKTRVMKAPRTYMPSENVPEPSVDDIAAGIVDPMDVPVHTPIPLLRLKTRQFRKEQTHVYYRNVLKREGRKPFVCAEMRRLKKLQRLRSSTGLPVTTFQEKAQKLNDSLDEDFHVKKNFSQVCRCKSCNYLRRWSSSLQPYRCVNSLCRIEFTSFTDLYEHQLDVHGKIDPRAKRVVDDLWHQQQGTLALPPATVYAGQQFMVPSRPPTPWESMEELDEEAKTLTERLWNYNHHHFKRPLTLFKTAYELVKRGGWKEMERQYHIAMEHYFSAMKFPASSRGFHDGCPSIERGRNWLTSTDREDSRSIHPFSLGDKVDVEPEFVLIDTKRDQEMYIELSDDSDDEDEATSANGKTTSEEKSVKMDDDVEMEFEDDDFKAAKERKVFERDSDGEVKVYGGDEDETTTERKVFDVDSDSDDDNPVKSEDNDSDSRSSGSDGDVEIKASTGGDSASDSDGDETASELQTDSDVESKTSEDKASRFVSDSDNESESDEEHNASKSSTQDNIFNELE